MHHIQWDYSFAENDYQKDTISPNGINASQLAFEAKWSKSIFGAQLDAGLYNSLKEAYATTAWNASISRPLFKDIALQLSYQDRSQPLNFNFHLFQSDYKEYNWSTLRYTKSRVLGLKVLFCHIQNGGVFLENGPLWIITLSLIILHPLRILNEKFKVEVLQLDKRIDYFKARFDQRLDFRKFSWINNVQFQEAIQEKNTEELLSGPLALNVPKWLDSKHLDALFLYVQQGLVFSIWGYFCFFHRLLCRSIQPFACRVCYSKQYQDRGIPSCRLFL